MKMRNMALLMLGFAVFCLEGCVPPKHHHRHTGDVRFEKPHKRPDAPAHAAYGARGADSGRELPPAVKREIRSEVKKDLRKEGHSSGRIPAKDAWRNGRHTPEERGPVRR